MDYIEIMNFCGYDLQKADKMAKEIIEDKKEKPED